jgi:TATA-box binding protein (TBP) (component of TFIID and TFIIIB)
MASAITPYRISTITATGSVNTEIDLDIFYDNIRILTSDQVDTCGIIYAEYGKKKLETVFKGESKKTRSTKRSSQKTDANGQTKRFDNQVTIVYRLIDPEINTTKNALNIKIFKNGNIQITGVKYIDQGRKMIDIIITMIRDMYANGMTTIVLDYNKIQNVDYTIRLINSDFKVGFPVKRELLYKVFVRNYVHDCCFEPCIYPGVKIRYFYNDMNFRQDGLCHCSSTCEIGKGCGHGDSQCKKITIAVFQSGCIIITGAQSHDQIHEAYDFISKIMIRHQQEIEKKIFPLPDQEEKQEVKTKKHLINKKNIIYPSWWKQD